MASYQLQIVTPDGLLYDGEAEKLIVRATTGDVCILAHHINFVTALGMGVAKVTIDGKDRSAACVGGMLSVHEGAVKLVASTFEWAEDIDLPRAQRAEEKARARLEQRDGLDPQSLSLAEAKLKRALIRQSAAERVSR